MSWSVYTAQNLEEGLAAEFDSNLSGLGTELGTGAYNMRLLVRPVWYISLRLLEFAKVTEMEQTNFSLDISMTLEKYKESSKKSEVLALPMFKPEREEIQQQTRSINFKIQCTLNAATSPACKINEETLTYLNQGQSYELKLKPETDSPELHDKVIKTVMRVVFHDKRLQFSEKELIEEWKKQHLGDRILNIDLPVSYNLIKYSLCGEEINKAEFLWDSSSTAGCFIQVRCISTEFTAKKHGGEKGVAFRIHLDNYLQSEDSEIHIYSASCQIKVFKPKGADRKHKTDREKMEKKADKHKYQPSYEYTVLQECVPFSASTPCTPSQTSFCSSNGYSPITDRSPIGQPNFNDGDNFSSSEPLYPGASIEQTQEWLKSNRFGNVAKIFQNFSGADLLRLRKEDLVQILGAADGIRLNNALQERHVRPRLTLYVCQEHQQIYHAMYLDRPLVQELICKLAVLYDIPSQRVSKILRQGPTGIRVLVSDEMVKNFQEESTFALEVLKDPDGDTFTIVMK